LVKGFDDDDDEIENKIIDKLGGTSPFTFSNCNGKILKSRITVEGCG
jgi:hypothetical protein